MTRKHPVLCAAAIAALLYVGAYAFSYLRRQPAANLAYWMYPGSGRLVQKMQYHGFYPVYRIHRVLPGAQAGRHNWDRPPIDYTNFGR